QNVDWLGGGHARESGVYVAVELYTVFQESGPGDVESIGSRFPAEAKSQLAGIRDAGRNIPSKGRVGDGRLRRRPGADLGRGGVGIVINSHVGEALLLEHKAIGKIGPIFQAGRSPRDFGDRAQSREHSKLHVEQGRNPLTPAGSFGTQDVISV